MNEIIFKELQELKKLTLLGTRKALTMDDCSLLTGLSKKYIYNLVHKKEIPYYKGAGGKLTYFNKQEIEDWQLQHRFKTNAEIETEATNYIVIKK